jgi:hypothetical protein
MSSSDLSSTSYNLIFATGPLTRSYDLVIHNYNGEGNINIPGGTIGELEAEKTKYVSLLEMNQDLGKKIIENLKIMNENKSEISYLKRKVADQQKEKGETSAGGADLFDDLSSNFELNLYQEDKKKAND